MRGVPWLFPDLPKNEIPLPDPLIENSQDHPGPPPKTTESTRIGQKAPPPAPWKTWGPLPKFFFESYFAEETAIFQLILARSISNWPDRWPKKLGTLQSISWSADNWRSDIRFSNFGGCTSKTGRSNHSFFFARNHHSLMWAADLCKKTAGMGPGSGIFFFYLQNGAADEKMTRHKKVLFWPLSPIYDVREHTFLYISY